MRRRPSSSRLGSSSICLKPPFARSSRREVASFSRSRPLGVRRTSGRALGWMAWRRSTWKYWAAVVQLTMRMFSCAASCMKRSSRALECSGPLPSYPCGRRRVSRERLVPLREARDDELVDHHLGRVDEVPELGLPEDERGGAGDRVAVLEADRGHLAERRVVDLDGRGRGREMGERRVHAPVLVVVQDEVPVRERAALGVLACEADRRAGDDKAREGEALGLRPVDPAGLAERFAPPLELLHELRMDREPLGYGQELLVELSENRGVDGGLDRDVRPAAEALLLLLRAARCRPRWRP